MAGELHVASPVQVAERATAVTIDGVTLRFGGVTALSNVSVDFFDDEIVSLVGPNGAGKSSLLNCISGLYRPQAGTIIVFGREVQRASTRQIARHGVGRTFQNAQLYLGLSVLDNILAGMILHDRWLTAPAVIRPWGLRREQRARRRAEEILDFLDLTGVRNELTEHLGYGVRKLVDVGRALASGPRLLLMDEPMAGLNLDEKADMARYILDIHRELRLPVILVDHDIAVVSDISHRAVVLDWGRVLAEGVPSEVLRRADVVAAYIGPQLQEPADMVSP